MVPRTYSVRTGPFCTQYEQLGMADVLTEVSKIDQGGHFSKSRMSIQMVGPSSAGSPCLEYNFKYNHMDL